MSSTQNHNGPSEIGGEVTIYLSEEEARNYMTDKAGNHIYEMSFCQRETPTYNRRATLIVHPKHEPDDMRSELEKL